MPDGDETGRAWSRTSCSITSGYLIARRQRSTLHRACFLDIANEPDIFLLASTSAESVMLTT